MTNVYNPKITAECLHLTKINYADNYASFLLPFPYFTLQIADYLEKKIYLLKYKRIAFGTNSLPFVYHTLSPFFYQQPKRTYNPFFPCLSFLLYPV